MWCHIIHSTLFASVQEKDLVPKLFKVLALRFETQTSGYTRMARIPNRQNLDRAKMAVLEYKGNPFPPLYPARKQNELSLINQLLKGYRQEQAEQIPCKVASKPWWWQIAVALPWAMMSLLPAAKTMMQILNLFWHVFKQVSVSVPSRTQIKSVEGHWCNVYK